MVFEWYAPVSDNTIEQGDILFDLAIPVTVESESGPPLVNYETYDLIVMTQSCDIVKSSVTHLILCPIWPLSEAAKLHPMFDSDGGKEELRQGRVVGFHMLNSCELPTLERELSIVQFERIIERPKESIQKIVESQGNRLRLLPPYREHLAQAFARFFMRIGLPIDIPSFK